MYEAHSFAIALGVYLLENDHLMTSYVAQVQESKAFLTQVLEEMGFSTWGRGGNSILAGLPSDWKAQELAGALKKRGFLIRVETHPLLSNHVRFTVGSKMQTERLAQVLREITAQRRLEPVRP
jgi:histidinol-phosphate/aromatic aminotransferase/cobyric acid decarboxylase-like protein